MPKKIILPRPIYPQFTVRGNDWMGAAELVNGTFARYKEGPWDKCLVGTDPGKARPRIIVNDEMSFDLGEIGLAYIIYRFRNLLDPNDARMFYRLSNYGSLTTLLNGALDRLSHTGQRYSEYIFTILDDELMGILTSYLPIPNSHICRLINEAELDSRVTRWFWRPTEMAWNLQGGLKERNFRYGVTIYNGETGHRAISFNSSVWTDSINGQTYQFDLPIREVAYARHMPTQSLSNALMKVESVLEENKLAEAFEQFAGLDGKWFTRRFVGYLDESKARHTSKEKVQIAFEDDVALYAPKKAVDMIYQLLDTAANINKSAALLAHQIVNFAIAEVMDLPRKPGGEVISDES
jgi:hypothetical protein